MGKADLAYYEIESIIWRKVRRTGAMRCIAPLQWNIWTGRAPAEFLRLLGETTKRQRFAIANRLIKWGGGDYDDAINNIYAYLGFKRSLS